METMTSTFDFQMFLEFHFLLMSLGTMLLFICFIVPYFCIAEHMTRNGYDEDDGAMQISIIGITNTIGMVLICSTTYVYKFISIYQLLYKFVDFSGLGGRSAVDERYKIVCRMFGTLWNSNASVSICNKLVLSINYYVNFVRFDFC